MYMYSAEQKAKDVYLQTRRRRAGQWNLPAPVRAGERVGFSVKGLGECSSPGR